GRLQAGGNVGVEAETAAAQRHRRGVGFFDAGDGAADAAGAGVDPVVHRPLQAARQLLNVRQVEAAVERAYLVGLAGPLGVLAVNQVRGVGDEQAALVRHHRGGETQSVEVDGAGLVKAVAVLVFQELDAAGGDLAGGDAAVGVA